MTRTRRMKDQRDGTVWRGCGDNNCSWCISNRTNKKNIECHEIIQIGKYRDTIY